MFGITVLSGCGGDSCYFGFVNNGKSGVAVAAGNLQASCPPQQAGGAVRVIALKSAACETCTQSMRAEHIFVTITGIELARNTFGEPHTPDWLQIAPQLQRQPRHMDLAGAGPPEILAESRSLPAGEYREVRLQFSPESAADAGSACGETRWNCMVLADGHAEPLRWPGDRPELLLAIGSPDSDSVAILPDAGVDLRLALEPLAYFSGTREPILERALRGSASMGERWSLEDQDPPAVAPSSSMTGPKMEIDRGISAGALPRKNRK
jgi:hypothetical protein